jgi:hypothetical protein
MISLRRIDNAINFAYNKYIKEHQLKKTSELTNLFNIDKEACKDIFNIAEKYLYYTIEDKKLLENSINKLDEYMNIHLHHALQNSLNCYFKCFNLLN